MLTMFQRVNFGKLDKPENKALKDLNGREIATLVPIVLLCLWIGLYPSTFLEQEPGGGRKVAARGQGQAGKDPASSTRYRRSKMNMINKNERRTWSYPLHRSS